MQCLKRCALAALVALAALAGLAAWWALGIVRLLDSPDPPGRAEAIVVLGEDPSRVLEGAELYRAGLAPKVLLSVPRRSERHERLEQEGVSYPWFEVAGRTILRRRDVPDEAVATFGAGLRSTAEEAATLRREQPDLRSILVVTSPYHVYRARRIFRDALPGVTIRVIGSRYEPLPARWWTDQEPARHVIMESVKLPFYWLGGRL